MSHDDTPSTANAIETGTDERSDESAPTAAGRARTAVSGGVGSGTAALSAGGLLLASAVRAIRRGSVRGRTAIGAGLGAALVGIGVVQRRRDGDPGSAEIDEADLPESNVETASRRQSSTPVDREDVAEELSDADAEAAEWDDGLNRDPRIGELPRPGTADVSEESLADEASEATGPEEEQSMPAQTEDTEPEWSPEEDHTLGERLLGEDEDEGVEGEEEPETGIAGSHPASETDQRVTGDDDETETEGAPGPGQT